MPVADVATWLRWSQRGLRLSQVLPVFGLGTGDMKNGHGVGGDMLPLREGRGLPQLRLGIGAAGVWQWV